MFSRTDIRRVLIAVNRKHYSDIIYRLGTSELIHLRNAGESETGKPAGIPSEEVPKIDSILAKLEPFLAGLDIPDTGEGLVTPHIFTRNVDEDEEYVSAVIDTVKQLEQEKKGLLPEIEALDLKRKELSEMAELSFNIDHLADMDLCTWVIGSLPPDVEEIPAAPGTYYHRQGPWLLGISLKENRDELLKNLQGTGFEDRSHLVTSGGDAEKTLEATDRELEKRRSRAAQIDREIAHATESSTTKLLELHGIYSALKRSREATKNFLFTDSALLIDGWADYGAIDRLAGLLKEVCGDDYYLTVASLKEMRGYGEEVPVKMKNSRLWKPFELLIVNFGIPGNRELDPTPVAAVTYILMFGVMFGDVGQGLVLVLGGFILRYFAAKNDLSENLKDGGAILVAAGASATLFGFLYGSVFSNEHLIPALWFHPMEHMMDLFFATIMMGAGFITVGMLLNIINTFQIRELKETFFSPRGLVGLTLYVGILVIFLRYLIYEKAPSGTELFIVLAVPLILFSLRDLLAFFFLGLKKPFPHGVFEYSVETVIEIIDMFSGFLGNTLSFIRVGAFALSHAGLSIAIYTLAGIIDPDLRSIGAILAIIAGNVFIILLEGLVCGIQSMRLEYYEFFSKFFTGTGHAFKPFSFRTKN